VNENTKTPLMSQIHHTVEDVTVKHINVRRYVGKTLLWLTLNSFENQLGPRTVLILRNVDDAVAKFFGQS